MSSTKEEQLSTNDQAVLNAIFNPFEPTLPSSEPKEESTSFCQSTSSQLSEEDRKRELKAIQLAEQDKLDESLGILDQLIAANPDCASLLNNRAQVFQLLKRLHLAQLDLDIAIDLSQKTNNTKVLGQSLCQRALIHRLNGNEEESHQDFKEAAKLGNLFARRQVVQLNPYAALCNQMLNQMLNNVRQGKREDA